MSRTTVSSSIATRRRPTSDDVQLCQRLSDRQQLQRRRTGIERRVHLRPLVAGRCRQGRAGRQQPVRQPVQPADRRRQQRPGVPTPPLHSESVAIAGVLAKPLLGHSGTHGDRRIPGHGPLEGYGGLRPVLLVGRGSCGGTRSPSSPPPAIPTAQWTAIIRCRSFLSCRDAITLPGQWSASWSRGAVLTGTPKGVCRQTSKKKGREPRGPCPFL